MKKITFLIATLILVSCSSRDYVQNPVDTLIKEMDSDKNFTIILFDMAEEGFISKDYKHKYKIIKPGKTAEAKPEEKVTDWKEVTEDFFFQHEQDMGMEIASKNDGKVTKQTAPPGYSNYVGNSQYGQWRTGSNGTSFWEFYGQYAFMSSMLGLVGGPVYRRSYTDYSRNYRGSRPYYGGTTTTGRPRYGTYSSTALKQNPRSNFASKVQNRTSQSRSGSRYGSSARSRSSSRGGK